MKQERILNIQINAVNLEDLIGGIHDLSESLVSTAFGWNANYYHDNPDKQVDFFCDRYETISAANRLICASIRIIDEALANGDIEIVQAPRSKKE